MIYKSCIQVMYTDSKSVKEFGSFEVYVIRIGQLGGALESFSGFCSFCFRAKWLPHLVCQSPETSRAFRWCRTHKADVIDDVTKQMLFIAFFCCFLGFRLRKWPPTTKGRVWKWWQEHGESLGPLIRKVLIFDKKTLEVNNMNPREFIHYES